MNKILTISIPTWNREILLKELVDDLTHQIVKYALEDVIEVLISDNHSDDNTWQLINQYKSKYDFIRLNRNNSNIGAKSNVLKSMELASSEYVMFLGDDDRIRKNVLPEIIQILKQTPDLGIFIDISGYKHKEKIKAGTQDTTIFFENLYWFMGNAGYFICKTDFFKIYLPKYGYDFFNECWPQTQIMILGIENSKLKPYAQDILLPIESKHDLVMVYSSYYLWRTCVYDLLLSINDIKPFINIGIFNACRSQMKNGIKQNFLNILQCGVFVDDKIVRKQTRNDIFKKLYLFSLKEKFYLSIILITLSLPNNIAQLVSNSFILLTRGKVGLAKKNEVVKNELSKKKFKKENSKQVRGLEFENL